MLGQVAFGWIDKRCKEATGYCDKALGEKSPILIGDPGQLPHVADKPLYHAKLSSAVGEQGYQTYRMFDKVDKAVNQRVQGMSSEQVNFRDFTGRNDRFARSAKVLQICCKLCLCTTFTIFAS